MSSPSAKSAELPDFQRTQYAFAAHVRDPRTAPRPHDVEDRRMAIYRDLFYNNVENFMSTGFPVLRSLLDDEAWNALVRDYFSRHRARTPLFPEMTREFIDFLQNERDDPNDYPFMLELAHYEWVELALSIAEQEIELDGIESDGDLLEGRPVLSPLAWPLSYAWEVHRIGPDYIPHAPGKQPTHLVVYRDRQDEIGFMEMNPVTMRLIQLFTEDDALTGRAALEQIAAELNHPNLDAVVQGGLETLQELRRRDIVLGTRSE